MALKRTPMPPRRAPLHRGAVKPKRPRDTGPSRTVRTVVRVRAADQCEFVFCPEPLDHLHHRRPRRAGGSSDPATNAASNCVGLCAPHHMWVEAHPADARVFGLILTATADPRLVPVQLHYHTGPVLLDDEGGWHAAA